MRGGLCGTSEPTMRLEACLQPHISNASCEPTSATPNSAQTSGSRLRPQSQHGFSIFRHGFVHPGGSRLNAGVFALIGDRVVPCICLKACGTVIICDSLSYTTRIRSRAHASHPFSVFSLAPALVCNKTNRKTC
jgi:hypothetical protein